jgi:subtilisin family serine protease
VASIRAAENDRSIHRGRWVTLLGRILLPFGLFAVALVGSGVNAAHAGPHAGKVAADLKSALQGQAGKARWVAQTRRGVYVQVVINGDAPDPELAELRRGILAQGGSVLYRYQATPAILAVLPVGAVNAIAARADVGAIVPNRVAFRTVSFLQEITGAAGVRAANRSGYTGAGVGIAILDSGIDTCQAAFGGRSGRGADCQPSGRIGAAVDMTRLSSAQAARSLDWSKPTDFTEGYAPATPLYAAFQRLTQTKSANPDVNGHGTHVASVAAGQAVAGVADASGIAPGAKLYDVRVLNDEGIGQLSDVLAGIDWVIANRREHNIRVLNLSLATPTVGSFLNDPLCRAARAAVASGITVVAAAGNYGVTVDGVEILGAIGAPGNEPSVITVGSAHHHGTHARADETINRFSSRGPTRSGWVDADGARHYDNLLKPDLVAPGNRIVGALAGTGTPGNRLVAAKPELEVSGANTASNARQMLLSGTSIAAPAVAGAVAVMLQANPGLTPPLAKAILQYTAQPLPGASLIQQGTGLLNVEGAVRVAESLRTDIASAVAAGTLKSGDRLLKAGASLPAGPSWIGGEAIAWSGMITAGGGHVVGGRALLEKHQAIYDPRLLWTGRLVMRITPVNWSGSDLPRHFVQTVAGPTKVLTAGVRPAGCGRRQDQPRGSDRLVRAGGDPFAGAGAVRGAGPL